ncbi:MAG: recombinase family protein [Clostridiales bacterium]|nr:recombinase family protein [Clostridiales bacterium]
MYNAIYARQSIDKKDSVSIEAQIESCRIYANTQVETYIDKGWSGKTTDRPMIKKLVTDIKNGLVDTVIVYRIDRISRNIVDFANLLNLFDEHNVKFISATEQFDTSSPMGKAMIYIIMVFAQLERETIAKRIQDNYRFRSSSGKYFMGGNMPFGYKAEKSIVDGKKASVLIIDDETSGILKDIFNRFIEEESVMRVAKYLNEKGVKTQKGSTWSSAAVKRILENVTPVRADKKMHTYLLSRGYEISDQEEFNGSSGLCEFFKNKNKNEATEISERLVIVGSHDPIIDSDVFIKAQFLLGRNSTSKVGKPSKKSFLAGLIKCADCGRSFGLKCTSRGNKHYGYYFCRGRGTRGTSTCENDVWIKQEELENLVIGECKRYLEELKLKMKSVKAKIDDDYSKIEVLENQIENLINNIGRGTSFIDELLTKKITDLQTEIREIKNAQAATLYEEDTKIISGFLDFDSLDIDGKTDVVRKLIEVITVDKDEKVTIKFLI